jgi:hypothetical protein
MNRILKKHGKKAFQTVLMLTAAVLLCACSQQDDNLPQDKRLRVQVTAGGFASDTPGTRTSDAGYTTSFTFGDEIGIFSVNGSSTVVDDNLRYRYNGALWLAVGEDIQDHLSATSYFAYYPYSAAMSGKTSAGDILAAFTPRANQSAEADYTASDLMTGSGTVADGVLSLELSHRLALVEVKLPSTATGAIFHIDGTRVAFHSADSVYRYLLKPAVITLGGVYRDGVSGPGHQYTRSLTLAAGTNTRQKLN